jgi:hypothetical protein
VGRSSSRWRLSARPDAGAAVKAELAEVAGQRKLLRWTVPGVAHFLVFWGFMILLFTVSRRSSAW